MSDTTYSTVYSRIRKAYQNKETDIDFQAIVNGFPVEQTEAAANAIKDCFMDCFIEELKAFTADKSLYVTSLFLLKMAEAQKEVTWELEILSMLGM